jgi:hypothetical protein
MIVSYWTLPGSQRGGLISPLSVRRCRVLTGDDLRDKTLLFRILVGRSRFGAQNGLPSKLLEFPLQLLAEGVVDHRRW